MLPKAHLTSHSRISGVITPWWCVWSGSLRSFLYSSVYCFHLFLISSAGPYHFCLLLCPSLQEIFPGISNFLEDISSLSYHIVFLYFFALFTYEGLSLLLFSRTSHSEGYIFSFLLCLLLLFFSQLFVRLPQTTILPFFFLLGMVFITDSCIMLHTCVHSFSVLYQT